MPEAAKAHTKAGAKAFVTYFWQVVNYAQATGDTDSIEELTDPACAGCGTGIKAIEDVYERGDRLVGGEATVGRTTAVIYPVSEDLVARVTVRISFDRSSHVRADGSTAEKAPAGTVTDEFHLRAIGTDPYWLVVEFGAVK